MKRTRHKVWSTEYEKYEMDYWGSLCVGGAVLGVRMGGILGFKGPGHGVRVAAARGNFVAAQKSPTVETYVID